MKKIFFNDKFGLTQAVLDGRKTITRRIVPFTYCEDKIHLSRYKVGEVVAIAQRYRDVEQEGYPVDSRYDAFRTANWEYGEDSALKSSKGWNNKLFTRADFMPHHIRITDIKVERLQDISDEDCLREGVELNTRQYEYDGTKKYCVCGLKHWRAIGCTDFDAPREAFAALIDKVSGKGTWESNPYVFVYEFKLID
jgi:hypothetical protein|nr:MAG TPA: ASCH domain protein [Caudoviricetes sp.]